MKKTILKRAGSFAASFLLSVTLFSTNILAANYTVLPQDSLFKISQLFKTSVNTLMVDNQLSSSLIHHGQILKVSAQMHTVKAGDSLFLIARQYNIPLTNLRIANNKWDDMILPGQRLLLPGIISSTLTTTTSTSTAPTNSTTTSSTLTAPTTSTTTSTSSGLPTTPSNTVIPYTAEEVNLLARLITAEATGEPYDAMVAVGAVVVNRVKSSEWPNSINSVINQVIGEYYQFTPVQNGWIKNPASDIALKAAWAALYGSDPSNGAIFYYDNSTTNQWIRSRPVTVKIGSMIYAK